MILRASRPPPTSSAPAPSAKSAGAPIPPLGGSAFAGAGAETGAGAGGAAFGGGGGGAALGGGGGGGAHGALATTPPACASITPSLHSASAFAPPAPAMFALASATTAGSSWARAGEAASRATATIAASIINFFNLIYLLLLESSFPLEADPLGRKSAPKKSYRSALPLRLLLAGGRRGLVDLLVTGDRVRGAQRDVGADLLELELVGGGAVLQNVGQVLGVAGVADALNVCALARVIARTRDRERLIEFGALCLLLFLLGNLRYGRYGGHGKHRQKRCQQHQLLHLFRPSFFACIRQGLRVLARKTVILSNRPKHNATYLSGLRRAFAPKLLVIRPNVGGCHSHLHNPWCIQNFWRKAQKISGLTPTGERIGRYHFIVHSFLLH